MILSSMFFSYDESATNFRVQQTNEAYDFFFPELQSNQMKHMIQNLKNTTICFIGGSMGCNMENVFKILLNINITLISTIFV